MTTETFTYPKPTYANAFREREHLARLLDQAKYLAELAKQVEDYSELVYEAVKLEQRIKIYEENRQGLGTRQNLSDYRYPNSTNIGR